MISYYPAECLFFWRQYIEKKQVYNPYLPLNEYVPDGEPHVFDGRVYIYGSHDRANGKAYCEGDYVTYSAPVNNLTDWKYEGVIYKKTDDPMNSDGSWQLWAPDVTKGPDGKYDLYYCVNFYPEIRVAVSDSSTGPFTYYGCVKYPECINDGAAVRECLPFDPAVLTDDDGRVYLYYGFAPACEKEMHIPDLPQDMIDSMSEKDRKEYLKMRHMEWGGENSVVVELEQDMLTVKDRPRALIPGGNHTKGTGFEGHGFFKASSIRKINDIYYFVYSATRAMSFVMRQANIRTGSLYMEVLLFQMGILAIMGRKSR